MLKLADNASQNNKALDSSVSLEMGDVTIANGGVLPNIQQMLQQLLSGSSLQKQVKSSPRTF